MMLKIEKEAIEYMQNKVKNEELLIVEVMTAELYEYAASQTAIYPKEKALEYLALGLTSEAGEVAGKIKKIIRDGEGIEGLDMKKIAIASEIGDVLWYCALMAKEIGVPLNTIMQMNLEKLNDRKERGTLQGSGDNR
jgi:NTP pyrophosphatase (non-canonical NTP hydrolase)